MVWNVKFFFLPGRDPLNMSKYSWVATSGTLSHKKSPDMQGVNVLDRFILLRSPNTHTHKTKQTKKTTFQYFSASQLPDWWLEKNLKKTQPSAMQVPHSKQNTDHAPCSEIETPTQNTAPVCCRWLPRIIKENVRHGEMQDGKVKRSAQTYPALERPLCHGTQGCPGGLGPQAIPAGSPGHPDSVLQLHHCPPPSEKCALCCNLQLHLQFWIMSHFVNHTTDRPFQKRQCQNSTHSCRRKNLFMKEKWGQETQNFAVRRGVFGAKIKSQTRLIVLPAHRGSQQPGFPPLQQRARPTTSCASGIQKA